MLLHVILVEVICKFYIFAPLFTGLQEHILPPLNGKPPL